MNYLDWIDQQINKHQTEIARLTVARGVIEEAGEAIRPDKPKLLTKPRRTTFTKGETRGLVFTAMRALGRPAMPKEIVALVRQKNPAITEKVVWNALYHARKSGTVVRGEGGYAFTEAPNTEAAA